MAIKKFILTGDTHGMVETRISNIIHNLETPECGLDRNEVAVIILGDAGLNFYLNKTDEKKKKILANYGIKIYCVRGNHEERPENLGYKLFYDDNVQGEVYLDPINNLIRYFKDGGIYTLNNHRVLTIGGAYSVDKWYRLERAAAAGQSFSGWFKDEQLSEVERAEVTAAAKGQQFDFVFTHTCPLSWEPTDLFLGCIDQSTVDKSMEIWLDELKELIDWKVWCFGHFHADRVERYCVEQFYRDSDDLEKIWNRWYGAMTFESEWWLDVSPTLEQERNK